VPKEATKEIAAGRMKGKFDISPMWRIQTLTREFGPAGIGWYTEVVSTRIQENTPERIVFLHIHLFVRTDEGWSQPIDGFGGAMIIAQEKNGLFFDDDAFKKAYTDAISQACRSLGIGADVYWAADGTKYETQMSWVDYINSLNTAQALDAMWKQYGNQIGDDKTIIAAFNKRKKEVTNGAE